MECLQAQPSSHLASLFSAGMGLKHCSCEMNKHHISSKVSIHCALIMFRCWWSLWYFPPGMWSPLIDRARTRGATSQLTHVVREKWASTFPPLSSLHGYETGTLALQLHDLLTTPTEQRQQVQQLDAAPQVRLLVHRAEQAVSYSAHKPIPRFSTLLPSKWS